MTSIATSWPRGKPAVSWTPSCNAWPNTWKKSEKLKAKVKGAMMYPIIVVCVAVLVIGVIMVFVIPVFQSMFAEFGSRPPDLDPSRREPQ